MIVVDANVTAYAIVKGKMSELARAVHARDSDWAVPSIWEHEYHSKGTIPLTGRP